MQKNLDQHLDNDAGVPYDALMNLTERANEMKIRNAAAKRTIQTKRSRDAKSLSSIKGIKHAKFPTYYKYG
jgi:hypothetical protein